MGEKLTSRETNAEWRRAIVNELHREFVTPYAEDKDRTGFFLLGSSGHATGIGILATLLNSPAAPFYPPKAQEEFDHRERPYCSYDLSFCTSKSRNLSVGFVNALAFFHVQNADGWKFDLERAPNQGLSRVRIKA
ncbi:hypothetical protein ACJ73_00310 [Blastomyces percursus]|uniref:Uncharacterized protein n=1 Tax=Blastomyces percursus TaxID=1658174 RepID=A0A1J9QIH2_9EURO|nr:hypothetical protein ACJ73_00310 [Blastomyces percursus]